MTSRLASLVVCAVVLVPQVAVAGRAKDIAEALKGIEASKPERKRKLLVFSVTRGFRHASIGTGRIAMKLMGQKTGAFEAVISDDLANFEPGNIGRFDAVCFLNTTGEVFAPPAGALGKMGEGQRKDALEKEARLKKSLMDFISSGKGFVGLHAATDTFHKWPAYGGMIGGYFDGHPWTAGTEVSIKVEKGQEKHACCVHLGGRNLVLREEIYQFKAPYDPKKLHILLRLDPGQTDISRGGRTDKDYAVSWVKRHGKGRVFYSSLGHNHHIYTNAEVLEHWLRGIQWALGDTVVEVGAGK